MAGLHASITPNHIAPGEVLTIHFDSDEQRFADARGVRVEVFEVDDASPLEPRRGRNALVVRVDGDLSNNDFTASGDPRVPTATSAPHSIRIKVEPGPEIDVPLPGADVEQGVYELRMVVRSTTPRAEFRSDVTVVVRAYGHFRTSSSEVRPVITFVTGAASDSFFGAAQGFWRRNADAMIVQRAMSLQEILQLLETEGNKYGPWGQINIVAHGAPHSINIKMFPDSNLLLHEGIIDAELDRTQSSTSPAHALARPSSIDSDTEVVFRSCNAGQTATLVSRIKDEFFPDAKFVKIPKWVQGYFSSATSAREFFQEELEFDRPTAAQITADEETAIRAAFDAFVSNGASPGLGAGADPAVEIPLFSDRSQRTQTFTFRKDRVLEQDLTDPSGDPMTDAAIVAQFRTDWNGSLGLDDSPATGRTTEDRWAIALRKTEDAAGANAIGGVSFRSTSARPAFKQLSGGALSLGSRSGDPYVWELSGTGIEDLHANITIVSRTRVTVEHASDSGTTVVGRTTLSTLGQTSTVSIPATITMGSAQVQVRPGRVFNLLFTATRETLHRRRGMRTFDSSQAYADRPMTPGDLTDSRLYETAQ